MAEAAARAEVADSQGSFEHERAAHQFSPDGGEASVGQRAFVGFQDFIEDLFFAVGA